MPDILSEILQSKLNTCLIEGEHFSKRQEGSSGPSSPNCLLKVDEDGLFLLWSFINQAEINVLESTHIREVTTGIPLKDVKALSGLGEGDSDSSSRVLTIYHGSEIGSLSILQFVSPTTDQAEKWAAFLNKVIHRLDSFFFSPLLILKKQRCVNFGRENLELAHKQLVKSLIFRWKRLCYSLSSRGMIPVRRIVKHFGHDKNEKIVLHKLKSCGFSCAKNDEIDPNDFSFEVYKKIHNKICTREDLDSLFVEVAGKKAEHIELSELIQWLNDHQRDPRLNEILAPPFDDKRASSIIAKYESCAKNCKNNRLSKQGFFDYLSSDDNCLVYREHLSMCHDMDQPLGHYFINSSHNTYLTGFQWRGKSSVDVYRHALLAGYRCIELDCWDGKGDYHGEPIITHGKAMCTDVVFKNVLVAIRDAAFVTSEYPVILSFETHCSKPLQLKMAKYCEEIFGDLLLGKPMESNQLEPGLPLPSPNLLKRKILIKNKRLDPEVEKAQLDDLSRKEDDGIEDESVILEEAHPEFGGVKSGDVQMEDAAMTKNDSFLNSEEVPKSRASTNDQTLEALKSRASFKKSNNGFTEDEEIDIANYEYTKTSATNIHPYLSSLVNYCQSVKFPGFKRIEDDNQKRCYQMSSFSESVGLNYLKSNAIDFVNYNRSKLSRIYPKGARFDSSNYMPQIFWNAGCQMVSLNAQTYDLGIQLNKEKFLYNGRSGYLLKPDVLLKGSKNFDPFSESTIDGVIAAQCGVKVISSQFLSDRLITSYVEVDMYGLPTDTIRKEFRTNTIPANGLNPIYNQNNQFLFRKIICPDLALLRFTLCDENRQLIGQRVVPLSSLQTGYRYVTLRNAAGVPLDSAMIFVKITLKSYVPESLLDIASALENPKAHQMSLMKQHAQQLKCLEGDDAEDEDDPIEEANKAIPQSNGTVRKNGKEESQFKNSRSKSSLKQRTKEQLIQKSSNSSSLQGSIYTKSEEKKAVEEVMEDCEVTMDALQSHPLYVKAVENHRKECTKRSRKAAKKNPRSFQADDPQATTCCTGLSGIIFARRRNSKNNMQVTDGPPPCDESFCNPLSPRRRRIVLLDVLDAIHQETREKLKKTQEKEMGGLTQQQTKRWIENSKVIGKDKSIPPAERERRIRDLKSQDIKNFTEVRQTMKNRQNKQFERLDAMLKEESEKVKKLIEAELD